MNEGRLCAKLDGSLSSKLPINAGVPQGSLLGSTLFLIYINDLPGEVLQKIDIYADDTTLYSGLNFNGTPFEQLEYAADLEVDLASVVEWGKLWLLSFNSKKTQLVSFNRKRDPFLPPIYMERDGLAEKSSLKLLGLTLTSDLSWNSYISSIGKSGARKVGSLYRSMKYLTPEAALYLYKSTIRPCMECCCHLWAGAPACHLDLLDRVQKRICHLVGPALASSLQPLSHRRDVASLSLFYRYYHGKCSRELSSLVPKRYVAARLTRYSNRMHGSAVVVPPTKKGFCEKSFFPRTSRLWNSLPAVCFPEEYNLGLFKSNVNRTLSK